VLGVTDLASLARRTLRLSVARAARRPLPFSITFILTHRCNFRCAYCDIPDAAGEEMTTDDYRRAIDELSEAGLARASFSGGEALLRRDAIDVIAHARGRGLTTSLNTNAWLAERHLDRLAGLLDMLVVSLDGPAPTHDLVRRQPGSYERVVRVLDGARERGIRTATITVLSGENLHVIDEVLRIAAEHGFWAYFQPAYNDCFAHGAGLDPALGPRILEDVAARLHRARAEGLPVGASRSYVRRLARAPVFGDCSRCHAGRYFGTVMPDGTLVPCHLTSRDQPWPNGRRIGFARAFAELDQPKHGPGCAISPYQESDLIFGLDSSALLAAMQRLLPVPRSVLRRHANREGATRVGARAAEADVDARPSVDVRRR
jgi:MoaA/NifB/PqqE/SkfB family radical SAM enzyme